jgi:S1-C subfamily serine protease
MQRMDGLAIGDIAKAEEPTVRSAASCIGIGAAVLAAALPALVGAAPSQDELNTIAVFRDASRGVVHVTAMSMQAPGSAGESGRTGVGTGFVLDDAGRLLTAYHVVKDRQRIVATLPTGEEFVATVVGSSEEFDVALLRIDAPQRVLFPLRLGDSTRLQVGQKVLAIGNGYGLHNSLSVGVISALGRTLRGEAAELQASFIQTDAAINPGNSGGPLLNSDGEVVGINDAMNPNAQSIGFAIPIHLVRSILPDLVRMGHIYRPDLGFSGTMVHGVGGEGTMGFKVQDVLDDSPAARSGLRAGRGGPGTGLGNEPGDIIVAVNGERISNPGDIGRAIVASGPGRVLLLRVLRGSQTLIIRLTLPEMQHPAGS